MREPLISLLNYIIRLKIKQHGMFAEKHLNKEDSILNNHQNGVFLYLFEYFDLFFCRLSFNQQVKSNKPDQHRGK